MQWLSAAVSLFVATNLEWFIFAAADNHTSSCAFYSVGRVKPQCAQTPGTSSISWFEFWSSFLMQPALFFFLTLFECIVQAQHLNLNSTFLQVGGTSCIWRRLAQQSSCFRIQCATWFGAMAVRHDLGRHFHAEKAWTSHERQVAHWEAESASGLPQPPHPWCSCLNTVERRNEKKSRLGTPIQTSDYNNRYERLQ